MKKFLNKVNKKYIVIGVIIFVALGFIVKSFMSNGQNYLISVGKLKYPRAWHTAVNLKDGRTLILGGANFGKKEGRLKLNLGDSNVLFNGNYIKTAEIFNPKTKKFSEVGKLNFPRVDNTATLLNDGRVLILGGSVTNQDHFLHKDYLSEAEIFNPKTNKFNSIEKMHYKRADHTATLLKNGEVLIAGGESCDSNSPKCFAGAEIFNPKTNKFILLPNMKYNRSAHSSVLMKDGNILITGGVNTGTPLLNNNYEENYLNKAEIFDPTTKTFKEVNSMHQARYNHSSILLDDGKVFIVGGENQLATYKAEIYDPNNNKFFDLCGKKTCKVLSDNKTHILNLHPFFLATGIKPRLFKYKNGYIVIIPGERQAYKESRITYIYNPKNNKIYRLHYILDEVYKDRVRESVSYLDSENSFLFIGGVNRGEGENGFIRLIKLFIGIIDSNGMWFINKNYIINSKNISLNHFISDHAYDDLILKEDGNKIKHKGK